MALGRGAGWRRFPWVDRVKVAFAEALGRGRPDLYVPVQHNTQWSGLLSDLQARAHNLAAEGLSTARESTYLFPGALDWTAQLFSSRRLVTVRGNWTASTPSWRRRL